MLEGVGPELRVWLKERKPKTAEELANLANDYVQSRKEPLIDGKYVSGKRNDIRRPKNEDLYKLSEKFHENNKVDQDRPAIEKSQEKFDKSKVKCFSCKEKGHYAHECPKRKKRNQNPAWLGV